MNSPKLKYGLKKRMASLGNLKGKNLSEITAYCGQPEESQEIKFADIGPGTRKTWKDIVYSVTLNFDKNDVCYGVAVESSKTGNIIIIFIGIIMAISLVRCTLISSSSSRKNKTSYYDLSPQEQENAKWAYEVQQAINGDD